MMDAQSHRGPDDEGLWALEGEGVLGHRRLSIMDPERGAQPVHSEDGSVALVANGMVYNHPGLRHQLSDRHEFSSDSDSETILHVFEERGLATSRALDGMFAFAIAGQGRLVLARDPIGIKPLYWVRRVGEDGHENIRFASEIKALADLGSEVREFPPGTLYRGDVGLRRYYTVPERAPVPLDAGAHVRRVRESVEAAVEKRLLSDVPLGAFLSGGLDSSIIAAIASRHVAPLRTFSVGTEGSRDLQAARRVARHIDSEHHEYVYTEGEVSRLLPEIVFHLESFDRDLVRSAVPTYLCARLASREVKVILTGEGADELFAGYRYHRGIRDPAALHEELRRSVTHLHNLNLQRVDRMTMRHGVEARVPFLDTDVVSLAQTVPPELKVTRNGGPKPIEKWVLRKAFEHLLPADIVWREKEQFDEGSGVLEVLPRVTERAAEDLDVEAYVEEHRTDRLRSREECVYHRLLRRHFSRPEAVLANVGRWRGERGPRAARGHARSAFPLA